MIGCCLLAVGCAEPEIVGVEMHRGRTWTAASVCIPDPAKVDVLLVIDDSPSMADKARALSEALHDFGQVYEDPAAALDYRIAVVSTHVSRPGCNDGPDGALQTRTCLEHLGDFEVTNSHESEPQSVAGACEEVCTLDALTTLPTALHPAGEEEPRPWIERDAGVHNLPEGVAVPEALACLGSLGAGGCERESPMAAVREALRRFSDPTDPGYGFLRDEAGLAIVFLGDEDDCSLARGASELDGPGTPSAQCWDAAAVCDEDGCEPREGPLLGVDALAAELRAIEARKQRMTGRTDQRVFASAVAGVPPAWPTLGQVFGPGNDGAFFEAFGVGPGCEDAGRRATPVVRLRELVTAFSPWSADLVSTCGSSWVPVLSCLPGAWPPDLFAPLCLGVPEQIAERGDFDPAQNCVLTETRERETVSLPACDRSCDTPDCAAPQWSLPPDVEACVAWEQGPERVDALCLDAGKPAEARILRRSRAWSGSCVEVTCGDSEPTDPDRL